MNRLTRILFLLCFAVSIVAVSYPTFAGRDTKKRPNKAFVMEVAVAGRPSFIMPVNINEKKIAVVPMNGNTASAVKIIPTAKDNSLQFELLAVVDKLPEKLSCENMKTLKAEPVTSYSARVGNEIRVSDFEKFGIASFVVKVRALDDPGLVCPDGACCCGGNTCYPNPGHCIECGSCGTCCRAQ